MDKSYQRRVRKKQARKARAQRLVTCRLAHGKKKAKRTARHREKVFTYQDETKDVQEKRIEYYKK